jgi:hypothetical protein
MVIAVDIRHEVVFAAEVVARPSATFVRLSAYPGDTLPPAGSYAGRVRTDAGDVPCALRVLDDRRSVWCQPRGPLPGPAVGQGMRVAVFADLKEDPR